VKNRRHLYFDELLSLSTPGTNSSPLNYYFQGLCDILGFFLRFVLLNHRRNPISHKVHESNDLGARVGAMGVEKISKTNTIREQLSGTQEYSY